jgi:hypothetical protein
MKNILQTKKKIVLIYISAGLFASYLIFTLLGKYSILENIIFFPKYFAVSFIVYLTSHLVRAIRLAILASSEITYFGKLLVSHLTGNSLNIIIPFRIGEIFRYFLISKTLQMVDRKKLILVFFLEKLIDLLFISIIASLAILLCSESSATLFIFFRNLLLIIASLILVLFPLLVVLIKFLNVYIAVNSENNKVLRLNLGLRNFIFVIDSFFKILTENFSKIIILTSAAWMLEILAIYLLIYNLPVSQIILRSSLLFSSTLLPTGPAGFGGLHISEYWSSKILGVDINFAFVNTYILYIFTPAAIFGMLLYFIKLRK